MANHPHAPHEIPDVPLLTEAATLLLEAIAIDAEVFEFGTGGSTIWLAQRASRLLSAEDDPRWHAAVVGALAERDLYDASIKLVETGSIASAIDGEGMWDVVFVDCFINADRRRAVRKSAAHVKPGGWLVADDYNFREVKAAVEGLRAAGWDVTVVAGIKMHPNRGVPVRTSTAFCRRTDG
jgi:predicted O-methyltransferase YrrM